MIGFIGFSSTSAFFLAMALAWAATGEAAAPRLGILHWTEGDHPLWGPRLAKGLRVLIDADSGFGGAPLPVKALTLRPSGLTSEDMAAGGAKEVAGLWEVDNLAHLEMLGTHPLQTVKREKWMPWKAESVWSLPLRLTVWEGQGGKVLYRGTISGEISRKAMSFWPYKPLEKYSFREMEALCDKHLELSLAAAKDTLAALLLGRNAGTQGLPDKPANPAKP